MTKINPTLELLRTSVLSLCYDDATLQGLCDRARAEGAVSVLMSLPRSDARKAIAGLLPRPQLVQWANASAQRAREYSADAADADRAAAYADRAAAYAAAAAYATAADAAAYAAAAAADAAAYATAAYADRAADEHRLAAEHRTAVEHGVELLGWA